MSIRSAGRAEAYLGLGGFRSVVRIAPAQITGGQMVLSDHAQMGLVAPDRGELLQSGDTWYSCSGQAHAADRVEGNLPLWGFSPFERILFVFNQKLN